MIVVDTNVVAYLYIESEFTAKAEALMAGNEHEVGTQQVLELVRDSGCSAYDCEFVALAQTLGVPLVTMDSQLLKAFPKVARSLKAP